MALDRSDTHTLLGEQGLLDPNLQRKPFYLDAKGDLLSGSPLIRQSEDMANQSEISSKNAHDSDENEVKLEISDSESQSGVIITEDAESTISSVHGEMCRICHCYAKDSEVLISPCGCSGSMKYVHHTCLQKWVKSRDTKKCELCSISYDMTSSVKPFRQWKKLDMSSVERRKVLCSVAFHVVAISCVIWSLYVLIEKTTHEIKEGKLTWPFWTKLVVVAIGFTGGLVFMYVQCKMYVQLFKKWKQFNRVIYINNVQTKDSDTRSASQNCLASATDDNVIVIHMANTDASIIATTTTAHNISPSSNTSHADKPTV